MLFSGIDLHKRSVAIHTLDAGGTVVRAANLAAHRRARTAQAFNGRFRGLQLTRTESRRWPRLASPPA